MIIFLCQVKKTAVCLTIGPKKFFLEAEVYPEVLDIMRNGFKS